MKRLSIAFGALLGVLTSIPVIVLSYFASLLGLPFAPFDLFDWIVPLLPGPLVTLAIDTLVAIVSWLDPASISGGVLLAEHLIALALFVFLGAAFGAILAMLGRWKDPRHLPFFGLGVGAVLLALTTAAEFFLGFPAAGPVLSIPWLSLLFLSWGGSLGWLLRGTAPAPAAQAGGPLSRRRFLQLVGTVAVTLTASAAGLGLFLRRRASREGSPTPLLRAAETSGSAASPPEEVLANRIPPAPGVRPEVTATEDFFEVGIRSLPPHIELDIWRLQIDGLVNRPLSLTLEELRSLPAVSQYVTLACISNPIGGSLIGTALYRGVRLKDLLERTVVKTEAIQVFLESADGFYEGVDISAALDERTLLVYEMNGQPLSAEHGFPLRLYVANRYGMKLPKWITHLEVVDAEREGYWTKRGWSLLAVPQTLSNIDRDTLARRDAAAQTVSLGGIAYAGDRGISKVEVQVDSEPWAEAELRAPPLSPLTWVQWRFDWPAQPGRHIARVRTYEGDGRPQRTADSAPHPDGATGIHSVRFEV